MSPRRPDNPPLDREHLANDPLEQFAQWFEEAQAVVPLAEAMTLATVDADGMPNARMVLLKRFGSDGFRFFTNYESAKGEELAASPRAALVIYWRELDRQVRVRGEVERLSQPGDVSPGGDSGGSPCAARARSQRSLRTPSIHDAWNSRQGEGRNG